MKKLFFVFILLSMLIVSSSAQDNAPAPTDVPHSVPLENIIFDDFDSISRALPYTDATVADIERLRDRITPLCNDGIDACLPVTYEDAYRANMWLQPEDMVIGYIAEDGQPYSYAFNILNYHEIVNDTLADVSVLISYCPLCNSAVVYSRQLNGETLIFGNTSALYNSDMVMYDLQTGSYWFQVEGRAIVGDLTHAVLTPLPAIVTTWRDWSITHPDTLSLKQPQNGIDYTRNPFVNYATLVNRGEFFFPMDAAVRADNRLPAATNVLVIQSESDDSVWAFPLDSEPVIDAVIDEMPIVILSDGAAAAAFKATLPDGSVPDLQYEDGVWLDAESSTEFTLSGMAGGGDFDGLQLEVIPARYTFWFAAVAAYPEIMIYP